MATLSGMPLAGRALTNLFSRPATRRYPEQVRPRFAGARGHVVIDLAGCTFCDLCVRTCPTGALRLDHEQRTLALEHLRCLACGVYVDACSPRSLTMAPEPEGAFSAAEAGPQGRRPRAREERAAPPPPPAPPAEAAPVDPAAPTP